MPTSVYVGPQNINILKAFKTLLFRNIDPIYPPIRSLEGSGTHSSALAWKIPWTEEPGGLQSVGLLRVKHDWASSLSLFTFTHWRRKWQPTPVFLPGESQGWGVWWAAVYGVAQSRTRLKWLSSSSSSSSKEPGKFVLPYTYTHIGWTVPVW